jgi:hypothetical protein
MALLYLPKGDPKYVPSAEDLQLLERFTEELWESYCTAQYISRSLRRRLEAKTEGPAKRQHAAMLEHF